MVIPWVTLRDWYLSTCSRDVERPSATRGGELVPKETMQKYENKYNPFFGDQKKKMRLDSKVRYWYKNFPSKMSTSYPFLSKNPVKFSGMNLQTLADHSLRRTN